MQKKLLKMSFIFFIILVFMFKVTVKATNDTNLDDLIVGSNVSETARDPEARIENNNETENEEEQEDSNEDVLEDDNDENNIGSTVVDEETNTTSSTSKTTNTAKSYTPPSTVQPTQSYSTVATIPEANLSLNNILNVILIAVGVILILLAIAILIRLK